MDSLEIMRRIQSAASELVAALRQAADEELPIREMAEVLRVTFTERNKVEAAVTAAVGALDESAQAQASSEVSMDGLDCPTWLSHTLNISPSAGYAQVHLARRLPSLPATAAAFERGELSPQHTGVVARCVDAVERGGGDRRRAEEAMLEEARQRDPRTLLRWGLSLVHSLAREEMEAEEERRERRRFLHLREVFDGGAVVEGFLDPERFARVRAAMEAVMGPRRKDDERSPGQRRADAWVEIADRALESGQLPARGGQKPHITLLASLETLLGDPGAPAALLDWGFPLSGKALRRIAADAEITPILVNERGDPLHVGRRYRTATKRMRRALAARDRRCVWPSCPDRPEVCQGDHEVPWADGGRTDLERMRLLCPKHHAKLSRGWRLERQPDGSMAAHPPPRPPQQVYGPAIHAPPVG